MKSATLKDETEGAAFLNQATPEGVAFLNLRI
jgi:hypothetical protein